MPATTPGVSKRQPRPLSPHEQARQQARRNRRYARYEQVRVLHQQGMGILRIAKQLSLNRTTVRRFAYATTFAERGKRQVRQRILEPYESYLQQRWQAGCRSGVQLWHELQQPGYPGSHKPVAHWVRQRTSLQDNEQRTLARIRQDPDIDLAYHLAQRFQTLIQERQSEALEPWITDCRTSSMRYLDTFATNLQREQPSLQAALAHPWSNVVKSKAR